MKNQPIWAERLLQKLNVTILVVGGSNGLLYGFQELTEAVAFRRCHSLKTHSDAVCGAAPRHYTAKSESFDPDFSVGYPKTHFDLCSGLDRCGCFDQASACARVGKVAPDRRGCLIDMEFDGDEALNPRVPSPVASPVRAEQIGLKWGRRARGRRNRLRNGLFLRARCGVFLVLETPALISRIAVSRASSRFSTGASR